MILALSGSGYIVVQLVRLLTVSAMPFVFVFVGTTVVFVDS